MFTDDLLKDISTWPI